MFAGEPMIFVLGMLASLLAAGLWLQIASYFGWPVSTTHSIVGAILGFAIAHAGVQSVHWDKVGSIVSSWVVSPLLSGSISYFIFQLIRKKIFFSHHPVKAAKQLTPYLVFFVFVILTLVTVFKGLKHLKLDLSLPAAFGVAAAVGLVAAIISKVLVNRMRVDPASPESNPAREAYLVTGLEKAVKHLQRVKTTASGDLRRQASQLLKETRQLTNTARQEQTQGGANAYQGVERIFIYLQILSACFVAFAHGANDVANAIGPLSAIVSTLKHGMVEVQASVPIWALGLGGVGIVIGLATWGWRVIETIGKRITELTPTRGFCAEIGAATTIVFASKLGLPISTTHTLVGAVLGVGLARGIGALNLNTVRDIIASWIITIPAGAILTVFFFYVLRFALSI
jgi:phosphate/sulfate permease